MEYIAMFLIGFGCCAVVAGPIIWLKQRNMVNWMVTPGESHLGEVQVHQDTEGRTISVIRWADDTLQGALLDEVQY